MKVKRFNEINSPEKYQIEYYQIEIPGEFDISRNEFDSFAEAIGYMFDNYDDEFVIGNFRTGYFIYKIKREETSEEFDMYMSIKKYNI